MIIFPYDQTFEGLLTALFDAYARRTFPDNLLHETEPLPLFYDEAHHVVTDLSKSERVWKALCRKLPHRNSTLLTYCWLSESPEAPMLLLRYMKKVIDSPTPIKPDFADQPWIIYDAKRKYGYFYNGTQVNEITFTDTAQRTLITGKVDENLLDKNEKLYQALWKNYFDSICIRERLNPVKHKKDMPVRYWKFLTEKNE